MMVFLSDGFDVSLAPSDEELSKVPTTIWMYGALQDRDVREATWMTYLYRGKNANNGKKLNDQNVPVGSIGFVRNANLAFPKFVEYTSEYLSNLLDFQIKKSSVNLMRTVGSLGPHIDEARRSCINIGLVNSSLSTTRINKGPDFGPMRNYLEYEVKEGSAYLVNVRHIHQVDAKPENSEKSRLLVSVSFEEPFEDIVQKLKPHVRERVEEYMRSVNAQ